MFRFPFVFLPCFFPLRTSRCFRFSSTINQIRKTNHQASRTALPSIFRLFPLHVFSVFAAIFVSFVWRERFLFAIVPDFFPVPFFFFVCVCVCLPPHRTCRRVCKKKTNPLIPHACNAHNGFVASPLSLVSTGTFLSSPFVLVSFFSFDPKH